MIRDDFPPAAAELRSELAATRGKLRDLAAAVPGDRWWIVDYLRAAHASIDAAESALTQAMQLAQQGTG
jgi:hypothetical protein